MFKKKVENQNTNNLEDKSILIASLLVHAARVDENYTNVERKIIKSALIDLMNISEDKVEELLKKAEKKEQESNQIVEFTKEIKNFTMESRLKIIEVMWKIVYSDDTNDSYESNLIRRVCGLLYVSDKDSGIIKNKVQNLIK
jgi:uncharacterized tellurite resistance protein B-like protein